jgi:hypothetical protein
MADKKEQKGKGKTDDGKYEEDLDTYFVDRMRFLNQKDHASKHLKQHFKVPPPLPPSRSALAPVTDPREPWLAGSARRSGTDSSARRTATTDTKAAAEAAEAAARWVMGWRWCAWTAVRRPTRRCGSR